MDKLILGRVQGQTDIELNDIGKKQAEKTGELIKNEKIDLIITSPLKRARKTAEIINLKIGVPIIEENKLTGEKKGIAIVGAEFEIYDIDNNLVDTVTTDENGIALSKQLLKGKYTIKETKAPTYYLVNKNTFNAEIINHKEIVNVDKEDESVDIKVEVEKTGFKETQSKELHTVKDNELLIAIKGENDNEFKKRTKRKWN